MSNSRIRNSMLNVITGIMYQMSILILNFISRTIFIRVLGAEYLGLNGLFSNILTILSLAELGIGNAILYSMYKPLAQNDRTKLSALITYYRKLYSLIAIAIAIFGTILVPFLNYFVNTPLPIDKIRLYYILFLLNSVISYLFIYKTSIINADQKGYKLKLYTITFEILKFILQIFILIKLHSYIFYIVVQIICTLMSNLICSYKTEKLYPYIKNKNQLPNSDKKEIWSNIKSLFLYQIGLAVLNNTDNILISTIIGTVWVGYYSNYSMIVNAISNFTNIIFTSIQSSVGNLNTEENSQKKYFIFRVLNLASFWIYGFCSICFCMLFQDFITIWIGNDFILDIKTVYVIVFNFYIISALYPVWVFRYTIGLFKHIKYVMVFASIINLTLSVIGGYKFGLVGVLAATAIARITTNIWYEPYKLFKLYFETSQKKYFISQILNFILLSVIICTMNIFFKYVYIHNLFLNIVFKLSICIIIPNLIFLVIFKNSEEFKYIYEKCFKKFLIKLHLS